MIQNKTNLLILVFLIFSIDLIAQKEIKSSTQGISRLIQESEKIYSIDDEIINGYLLSISDKKIPEPTVLEENQWNNGTFFIHGRIFQNLLVKYDFILDDLTLKTRNQNGGFTIISINKSQVDSFIIVNSLFINSLKFNSFKKEQTYYEKLYGDKTFTLKKQVTKLNKDN